MPFFALPNVPGEIRFIVGAELGASPALLDELPATQVKTTPAS